MVLGLYRGVQKTIVVTIASAVALAQGREHPGFHGVYAKSQPCITLTSET